MRAPVPPRAPAWLITLLVPPERAELVLGDLEEEFTEQAGRVGAGAARRAYWRAALCSIRDGGRWHGRQPDNGRTTQRRRKLREVLMTDARLALRALRRRPTYAIATIVTLAVAIGATVAVLSIVNGVLMQPLPYEAPDELFTLWRTDPSRRSDPAYEGSWNRIGMSIPELDALRTRTDAFAGVAGFRTERRIVAVGGVPEERVVARATPSLFPLLGIPLVLGRPFTDAPQDEKAALISHEMWQDSYARNPAALGSTVHVHGVSYTVIGVLPRTFGLQAISPYLQPGRPAVWTRPTPADLTTPDFEAVVRLRSPASLERAGRAAEAALLPEDAGTDGAGVMLEQRHHAETVAVRRPLYLLLLSTGLFLLLGCLNVGTLSLAQGEARSGEIATRIALGASRAQIAGYLLIESALLAAAGTAGGVLLARAAQRPLLSLSPFTLHPGAERGIDTSMLPYVGGILVLVLLVCGSAPALRAWRLAAHVRGSGGTARGGGVLLHALISAQFALATVLLVSAALLTRSLYAEANVPTGFATGNRVAVQVRPAPGIDATFTTRVSERLAALPGVERVTLTRRLPLRDPVMGWRVSPQPGGPEPVTVSLEPVGEGYFSTMGIPILEGRGIEPRDVAGSALVVVVSRALAEHLWPGMNPIGRPLSDAFGAYTVVGIAGDVRDEGLDIDPAGIMYPAVAQTVLPGNNTFVLLASTPIEPLQRAVRDAVRQVAPGAAIRAIVPLDDVVSDVLAADRYRATLGLLFAALAVLLAAIGLSALVIHEVGTRMKEFAIRLALGATAGAIARLPLHHAASGIALGALLGVAGSLAVGRMLASYLYGVQAGDPVTLAVTIAVLAGVVLTTLVIAVRRTRERDLIPLLKQEH